MIRILILLHLFVFLGAAETGAFEKAEKFYKGRCLACHGKTGKGDGAASAYLKPKPRDFSKPSFWEKADDERMKLIIIEGGAKHKLSPLMPPHKDLKPEIADQMIILLRGFKEDSTQD